MDTFATRIEAMEHTARERSIGMCHDLDDNVSLFVVWQHVKKLFVYFTVDSRYTRPGVNTDGFTDLTREQAAELLK